MEPKLPSKPLKNRAWIPYFVLAIALSFTAATTSYVTRTARTKDRLRFENAIARAQDDIINRSETYITLLRAGSGLFAADSNISRSQFRNFVNRLKLQERYPGIQGIGYSLRIQPQDKDKLVAAMRQQGIANFNLRPSYPRSEYHAIIYLEPQDRRNKVAIGYDMFTERTRRAAMERARDTGLAAASGKVTLVQEIDKQKQAGFLLYVPVYRNGDVPNTVAERRANLIGFVYSPFRADDLIQGVIPAKQYQGIALEIYAGKDINSENLLHRSTANVDNSSYQPSFQAVETIDIAGTAWSIVFNSLPEFASSSESRFVPYIGFAGIAIALILFGITRSLVTARNTAESSTEAFRESSTRLRFALDAAQLGDWELELATQTAKRSLRHDRVFGHEELLPDWSYEIFLQHVHPEDREYVDRKFQHTLATNEDWNFECRVIWADKSIHWIWATGSVYRDAHGNPIRLIGIVKEISDRKLAEAAIKASEERYRAFISQSSEGIWRFELKQPITIETPEEEQIEQFYQYGYLAECNDVMAQMYGFNSAAELVGVKLGELLPQSETQNIEYLRSFIRSGYKLNAAESCEVDAQGKAKYFLNNLVGIVENGYLVRAWGTQLDISDRKQLQESLKQKAVEQEVLLSSIPAMVYYKDVDLKYIAMNRKAAELIERSQDEIVGKTDYDFFPYAEATAFCQEDREVIESGKPKWNIEEAVTGADGKTRWMSTSKTPYVNSQGEVTGLVGITLDISDRKLAEEERDRFFTLSLDLLCIVGVDGYFKRINPAFEKILGYSEREILTQPYINFVHPEDRDATHAEAEKLAAGELTTYFENRYKCKDGSYKWLAWTVVPVVEAGLLYAVAHDITNRKTAEMEREQLLRSEQTARATAEAANRMKDEFLATLSHELRTPLNAMVGWVQLLRTRKFDENTTARALETIDRNTKSLKQLIEDILDVSRIITGKIRLNFSTIELQPVIAAAIETVQPAASAKKIQIETILDPAIKQVFGDASRLQQVFWNLLSNAVKFTPNNGRIKVKLEIVESRIQVRVSDSGQGIEPDFLPYVFERFRQEDGTTTRNYGGLGLGLSIVRHLVELHGGTVRAESPGVGKGATFIVNLPIRAMLNPSQELEQEQPIVIREQPIFCLPSLSELQVLVVDDEADARDLISIALSEYGAEVTTAASASEALEKITQSNFDVLVSDIGMPEEDGYTLMQKVRALNPAQKGKIPAIALTAYARAEDRTKALLAGFGLHVPKPVDPAELAVAIANLAGRSV
ncbi:CHASE domain-containing protein [Aliterella atlantica]|uniref:CHASE domain-containing protein n=1 Tax=Aliterella atlantica TaxID=1827278 RepID=UPI0006973989|nr:CHASE domain-containing protein [Aliterella atlantica]